MIGNRLCRIGDPVLAHSIEFRQEALPPLASLERQWRDLEATAHASFFTSWHWIGTLLRALPDSAAPTLLRGSLRGETVTLALLGAQATRRRHGLIRSRSLHLNETGNPALDLTIEHNGLLVGSAYALSAVDGLIRWFADHDNEVDELHIGGCTQRLSEALVEGRGLARNEIMKPGYFVELSRLGPGNGALDAILSRNARQQLRRALRYFERFGHLDLQRATNISEAHAFFTQLKTLHVATWEKRRRKHSFSHGFFEQFHRLLIDRSFGEGAIELLRARAGARVIGYLYNFRFSGRVYAYQNGFAYDDTRARPGAVTQALAIGNAYRSGASVYDFLAGHNRLKESFSTHCQPMYWLVLQQPRLAFRLEHAARRFKASLGSQLDSAENRCRSGINEISPVESN